MTHRLLALIRLTWCRWFADDPVSEERDKLEQQAYGAP
jgi:hypothetical protein